MFESNSKGHFERYAIKYRFCLVYVSQHSLRSLAVLKWKGLVTTIVKTAYLSDKFIFFLSFCELFKNPRRVTQGSDHVLIIPTHSGFKEGGGVHRMHCTPTPSPLVTKNIILFKKLYSKLL